MAGLHIYNNEGGLVIGPDSQMGNMIGSFTIPRISRPYSSGKLSGSFSDGRLSGGVPFLLTVMNSDTLPLPPDLYVNGNTINWNFDPNNALLALVALYSMDDDKDDLGDITVFYGVM